MITSSLPRLEVTGKVCRTLSHISAGCLEITLFSTTVVPFSFREVVDVVFARALARGVTRDFARGTFTSLGMDPSAGQSLVMIIDVMYK